MEEQHVDADSGINFFQKLLVFFGYGMMIACGKMWETIASISAFFSGKKLHEEGYAPMLVETDRFYIAWLFKRISDAFNRPITGLPGAYIDILERKANDMNTSFTFTGKIMRCLNLGSYNYLGFAENSGPVFEEALKSLGDFNTSNCASSAEGGYIAVHKELEEETAAFVGKESAIVFEMGYATNSTTLPALIKKGALIISDTLNHASLVMGLRASGGVIKVFNHNDTEDMERVLRNAIAQGQPRTGAPYSMIIIVIEGIYSMEGVMCNLPEVIRIKKKYKAYLYVDEAHSIGAVGPRGRGVCDYFGVDTKDVDILMGTFTKSFAAVGGYIAGDKEVISYLRASSFGTMYSSSMSAVCAQQALSALRVIMGKDAKKLRQLNENSNYFRQKLIKLGFLVLGNDDSPIIPLMLYHPAKFPAFSRQLLKRGIATVVVAYPATSKSTGRARLCLSAGHTKKDLDYALEAISEVGDCCGIKYMQTSKYHKFLENVFSVYN